MSANKHKTRRLSCRLQLPDEWRVRLDELSAQYVRLGKTQLLNALVSIALEDKSFTIAIIRSNRVTRMRAVERAGQWSVYLYPYLQVEVDSLWQQTRLTRVDLISRLVAHGLACAAMDARAIIRHAYRGCLWEAKE